MSALASLLAALDDGTTMRWAVEHGADAVECAWRDGRDVNEMVALLNYCGIAHVNVHVMHRSLPPGRFEWRGGASQWGACICYDRCKARTPDRARGGFNPAYGPPRHTSDAAIAAATAVGWKQRAGGWLCPKDAA